MGALTLHRACFFVFLTDRVCSSFRDKFHACNIFLYIKLILNRLGYLESNIDDKDRYLWFRADIPIAEDKKSDALTLLH